MPGTRILLVRHGQSVWNALGRWQGHADPPLSPAGKAQARAAAEGLDLPVDVVVASDLVRARSTAEIMAGEIDRAPVTVDPRLRETDAGEWQGLTRTEIDDGWPGYLDTGRRPPGFEPYDVAAQRLADALHDLHGRHAGATVLGVSHGGVIRALRHLLGGPGPRLPNLAGGWFEVTTDGIALGPEVHLLATAEAGRLE